MSRETDIEQRIAELRQQLENIEGTPTEVYTRIVGYYRSLKNWNRGKREEYDHRVTFKSESSGTPSALETGETAAVPVAEAFAEAAVEAASISAPAARRSELESEAIQSRACKEPGIKQETGK